jgi:hypothetical protein
MHRHPLCIFKLHPSFETPHSQIPPCDSRLFQQTILNLLTIWPTRCTNFSKVFLYFGMKLYMFQMVPLSIIRIFPLYTQQWCVSYSFADSLRAGSGWNCSSILILLASCMTYTIPVCTVENSWWWTEDLSKTCRVSFWNKKFWEISASCWFYCKKFIMVHRHMNIKQFSTCFAVCTVHFVQFIIQTQKRSTHTLTIFCVL